MKRIFLKASATFLFAMLMIGGYTLQNSNPAMGATTSSYIVTFEEGTPQETMDSVLQVSGVEVTRIFSDNSLAVIKTEDTGKIDQLRQESSVQGVDLEKSIAITPIEMEEQVLPQDPIYQYYQWHIRRVKADQAWNAGYTASHETVVGIVDVGVASNHPDLQANIVYEACFTSYQTSCETYPQFPSYFGGGHGTRIAGIIGSTIDGSGTVGVAPDVGIANYNVAELDPNGFPAVYDSSIWAAIEDAANKGIDVLNFSFTEVLQRPLSPEDSRRVANWLRVTNYANAKGVVMVAAAGNSNTDLSSPSTMAIPCELPGVACVAATNIRPEPSFPQEGFYEEPTFYTSYGEGAIDFAAPGGDCGGPDLLSCYFNPDPRYFVWTTDVYLEPVCSSTESCYGFYNVTIGTSLSAPHAAGVAALVRDAYYAETGQDLRPEKVIDILKRTAEPVAGHPEIGAGVVNAEEAVNEAMEMTK